ncbi:hypothetical protein GEMRC1_009837 [Eukaryota sp. GEM-RC1]
MCQSSLERLHLEGSSDFDFSSHLQVSSRKPLIRPGKLKYLSLQSISLRDNWDFLHSSVLPNCPLLQELDLSHSGLHDLIDSRFLLTTSISVLNLSHCRLGDAQVEILANLLLMGGHLRLLNIKHNPYSLLGHSSIVEACSHRKYVQVFSSYPDDVIDIVGYDLSEKHALALNRLMELYDSSGKHVSEIRFSDCCFSEASGFGRFVSLLKTNEFINHIVFIEPKFSFQVLLILYAKMKLMSHVNVTLLPYQLNVSSGLLGFVGPLNWFVGLFPSNLIELLIETSIKMLDCSKATFDSVDTEFQLGLILLKATNCSFTTPRVKWDGENLELDLSELRIEYLTKFKCFPCLKKLNLRRVKGFSCNVLDLFPYLEDLNLSFTSNVSNFERLNDFVHLDRRCGSIFRDEAK